MDLTSGQINSLIALGISVLILVLLNVFGKRDLGSDTDTTSD